MGEIGCEIQGFRVFQAFLSSEAQGNRAFSRLFSQTCGSFVLTLLLRRPCPFHCCERRRLFMRFVRSGGFSDGGGGARLFCGGASWRRWLRTSPHILVFIAQRAALSGKLRPPPPPL